jgi:hypothetical protein
MLNITIHIIYFIFSLSSEKVLNETQKDWLQPVATGLRRLRDFLKMMQPATSNFKNQRNRNQWSGPLQSGCVRLLVFLRSIGLDLQTLLCSDFLAWLGLKARSMAWLFVAYGLKNVRPGP